MNLALHLLAGLGLAYAVVAFLEWYTHRFHMHRRGWMNRFQGTLFEAHSLAHHPAYRRDFTDADPAEHAATGVDSDVLSVSKLIVPLALPLALVLPVEAAMVMLGGLAHSILWTAFHREMHMPKGRWFARTRWYRACLARHEWHHRRPGTNYGALLFGPDWLFGTGRRS